MDLTTQTPAEIDAQIAPLESAWFNAYIQVVNAEDKLARRNDDYYRRQIVEGETKMGEANAALEPLRAEYTRRGGWTRAFLVENNGGHIHNTLSCSTCRPTTRRGWLTDLSGHDMAEIVDLAGEKACTICFPDAPVKPSMLPHFIAERAEKAQAAQEKAEKAAAKAAKGITNPDGTELMDEYGVIKTERGAYLKAMEYSFDLRVYNADHPFVPRWVATRDACINAIAAKNGTDRDALAAEIEAKTAKKYAREYGN